MRRRISNCTKEKSTANGTIGKEGGREGESVCTPSRIASVVVDSESESYSVCAFCVAPVLFWGRGKRGQDSQLFRTNDDDDDVYNIPID